jgi:hypothetical protein
VGKRKVYSKEASASRLTKIYTVENICQSTKPQRGSKSSSVYKKTEAKSKNTMDDRDVSCSTINRKALTNGQSTVSCGTCEKPSGVVNQVQFIKGRRPKAKTQWTTRIVSCSTPQGAD